jgi:two-component system, NtrC family, sensor kinase
MDDYYRVPTLTLLAVLVAVFGALYFRSRTHRRLLWLIGWIMATLRVALMADGLEYHGFGKAASNSAMMLAAVMFMGALSPVVLSSRLRISYVVPFSIPLLFFTISTSLDATPGIFLHLLNIVAAGATVAIGVHWGWRRRLLPAWFTLPWPAMVGVLCIYYASIGNNEIVLRIAHSGISLMTGLLVLAAYRRLSPGVIFTATGFFVWSLPLVLELLMPDAEAFWLPANRMFNLMKVVTAMGMIVLVLEDEARENEAAQGRDRRARAEMEQYAKLDLAVEPHHDFGIQYSEVCETIVRAARFRQAAIFLLDIDRNLHLTAFSGIDAALATALAGLGLRLSAEELQRGWQRSKSSAMLSGHMGPTDLRPWIRSGDELDLQNFSQAYTIPLNARSGDIQGILMLGGLKDEKELLLPEDLLPLELLVARVAAARENGLLSRRITRSEKLAGIGRLAGGVAHELNNPLTVVMGYAELIFEGATEERVRHDAGVIRLESQRMRQIIESLARFWKPSPSPVSPLTVPELLAEVESQRRADFESRQIQFDVTFSDDLPRIIVSVDQMRQILLKLLDNAASVIEDRPEKRIHLEACLVGDRIHIVISDNGPGFPNPDKVFDPFFATRPTGEGPALALSLCYSIVREQGGDISAINLQPHGGAVVIELPVEPPLSDAEHSSASFAG